MKDKGLTWEETIQKIRSDLNYAELVINAYFDEDLKANITRYQSSEEFKEIRSTLIREGYSSGKLLDIGSGNGISAVAFALNGFEVTAVEPDSSNTIGAGAIRILKEQFGLTNLSVYEAFAEDIKFENEFFDIVFVRQAVHHAYDLKAFIREAARVLKKGGIMLTVRDHVVFDETDKNRFLEAHPLHKFYGGENAFSPTQYEAAFSEAGLSIIQKLKYFDSVINYFPNPAPESQDSLKKKSIGIFKNRFPKLGKISIIIKLYMHYLSFRGVFKEPNERTVPGRMYSYILSKH